MSSIHYKDLFIINSQSMGLSALAPFLLIISIVIHISTEVLYSFVSFWLSYKHPKVVFKKSVYGHTPAWKFTVL